jgi:hypothetical protein
VPLYTLDAVATMLEEQAHSVLEEFNVTPDAWDAARWLRSLTQEET